MKKSDKKAIPFIKQAINAIGNDLSLNDAKNHLYKALRIVEKAGSRREKRKAWADRFAEEAKKKEQEWWDKIKEQTSKLASAKLEEKKKDK